jgi:porin
MNHCRLTRFDWNCLLGIGFALAFVTSMSFAGDDSPVSSNSDSAEVLPSTSAFLQPTAELIDPCCPEGVAEEPTTPQFAGPISSRPKLTGDWFGVRDNLAARGITFDLYGTQFYQGIASGGRDQEWEYGGKLDYLFNLDGEKVGLWQGLFVNLHAETRYGSSVNQIAGLISPSNVAMLFPKSDETVTAITGLKITQALSENVAVFMGKINTLDEYPFRFSPLLGLERPGIGGFMNSSLVFNPIMARTVPYSAAGVGVAYLRDGQPLLALTVFDPQERATIGLEDLFERGVVLVPNIYVPVKLLGRPGLYNFGATYSNAQYRSTDPEAYEIIPNVGIVGRLETGSWSLFANFYQALWVDPCDEKRTWGLFGQFGLSDGNPNAIRCIANGGFAGRSMIAGRTLDTFGIGFFYLGLSESFKALTAPLLPLQDEYGIELFYNLALTPWSRLTIDLQVAEPSARTLDTVVVPGLRLMLNF